MNRELTERWIEALESDEYVQGRGALSIVKVMDGDAGPVSRMCCLGVGCDVFNPSGWQGLTESYNVFEGKTTPHRQFYDEISHLPNRVAKAYDITVEGMFTVHRWSEIDGEEHPILLNLQDQVLSCAPTTRKLSLMLINDDGQFTYQQIAAVLRLGLDRPDLIEFEPYAVSKATLREEVAYGG